VKKKDFEEFSLDFRRDCPKEQCIKSNFAFDDCYGDKEQNEWAKRDKPMKNIVSSGV